MLVLVKGGSGEEDEAEEEALMGKEWMANK